MVGRRSSDPCWGDLSENFPELEPPWNYLEVLWIPSFVMKTREEWPEKG